MSLQNDGRLRLGKQNVVYKSSKTGKVDNIPAGEINLAQWRRVCLGHGIKLGTSTGHIYKYDGFRDTVSVFCYTCETQLHLSDAVHLCAVVIPRQTLQLSHWLYFLFLGIIVNLLRREQGWIVWCCVYDMGM